MNLIYENKRQEKSPLEKSSATRLVREQSCLVTKMIKLFGFSFKIHFMCAR